MYQVFTAGNRYQYAAVSDLPASVCRTFPTQYDGMSLHCRLCLLQCNVVSLCGGFVTTELVQVSLQEEEWARTLAVLDVDGTKRTIFNVKNIQTVYTRYAAVHNIQYIRSTLIGSL